MNDAQAFGFRQVMWEKPVILDSLAFFHLVHCFWK